MTAGLIVGATGIGPADPTPERCRAEAEEAVVALAAAGARLVVLPELFAWPYVAADDPARWGHLAEPAGGATLCWAEALSERTGAAILFGAAIAAGGARPLNAAVLARPGGGATIVAAKMHLPPAGAGEAFGEPDHFEPGPPAIRSFPIEGAHVAALVCYDRRFPECWRAAAASGADCVAVLVAGPAPADPEGLFEAELMTHARANGVYAVSAARFGEETVTGRPVRHDGRTLAFDPDGRAAGVALGAGDDRILVPVDPQRCRTARAAHATADRLRPITIQTPSPLNGVSAWHP